MKFELCDTLAIILNIAGEVRRMIGTSSFSQLESTCMLDIFNIMQGIAQQLHNHPGLLDNLGSGLRDILSSKTGTAIMGLLRTIYSDQ